MITGVWLAAGLVRVAGFVPAVQAERRKTRMIKEEKWGVWRDLDNALSCGDR